MSNSININVRTSLEGKVVHLPASKSISNRVLIMDALSGSRSTLHNLSDANDTQLMLRLIKSEAPVIDVEDAGTTMRFLTAYFAVTGQKKLLTGTDRMQERPIGILVDALRMLGAKIGYTGKDGYPPLSLEGFQDQQRQSIDIRGDVSSQFISAIMMIAPVLSRGLTIHLKGKIGSKPYIEMTAELMRSFGADCRMVDDTITITPSRYTPSEIFVESDWSGASYWFAFTALADHASLSLPHLFADSLQGDQAIKQIMEKLGVASRQNDRELVLTKTTHEREFSWDFTHCPDLAQTVAVVCAAKGIKGYFTGLESLRIKETDRIKALQQELFKINATLTEKDNRWTLTPSVSLPAHGQFETYKDHRMAMAFAPLATRMDVTIHDPMVVRKSYPKFWDDMKLLGFDTTA